MRFPSVQYDIYQPLSGRVRGRDCNPIEAGSTLSKAISALSNSYDNAGINFVMIPRIPSRPERGHAIARYTVLTGNAAKAYSIKLRKNPSAIPPLSKIHIGGDNLLKALEKNRFDIMEGQISDSQVKPPRKPALTIITDFANRVLGG